MDRLTERNTLGEALLSAKLNEKYEPLELIDVLLDRLAAYEDSGLTPDEVGQIRRAAQTMMFPSVGDFVRYSIQNFEELEKYRKAKRDGRLIALPCKVGDTVYAILGGIIYEAKIIKFAVYANSPGLLAEYAADDDPLIWNDYGYLGTHYFLTREEAEAALGGAEHV